MLAAAAAIVVKSFFILSLIFQNFSLPFQTIILDFSLIIQQLKARPIL